jgi:hypothetical protein
MCAAAYHQVHYIFKTSLLIYFHLKYIGSYGNERNKFCVNGEIAQFSIFLVLKTGKINFYRKKSQMLPPLADQIHPQQQCHFFDRKLKKK